MALHRFEVTERVVRFGQLPVPARPAQLGLPRRTSAGVRGAGVQLHGAVEVAHGVSVRVAREGVLAGQLQVLYRLVEALTVLVMIGQGRVGADQLG
jgi:hypothetical protein